MQALILAGGSGTRFWPLSRRSFPKQFLALEGGRSLLQTTVDRQRPLIEPGDVWVSTTEALAEEVRHQLPEVPPEQVLAEPTARNTAPAIGWALRLMPVAMQGGVVAVLPADHRVENAAGFRAALESAASVVARDDRVMTLGVTPSRVETGYGYLELGSVLDPEAGLRRVRRFTEKPDRAAAERFVESGDYLWNAGIFVFRGSTLLAHLARLEPVIGAGLEAIAAAPERTAELYGELPSISIDYAVMERLEDLATLPLDCGWSDLGSWASLGEILVRDEASNTSHGDVLSLDAADNLLWAAEGQIAVLGVSGLIVVRTADTVVVLPKERAQEVQRLVEALSAAQRDELL
ncbi:MAG: sugar phosphate nucleotidyltransferase [Acidobacteria bacterium]|nr:sugar phosphate nucleotidyltransferase [Acidobacteriota bacterium]